MFVRRFRRWLELKSPGGEGKRRVRELIERGDAARDIRDWTQARDLYEQAVVLDSRLDRVWVQLGHARKEAGDLTGGEAAYRAALDLAPATSDTHLQLGHVLKLAGRLEDAVSAYDEALRLDPDNIDARVEGARLAHWRVAEVVAPAPPPPPEAASPEFRPTHVVVDLSALLDDPAKWAARLPEALAAVAELGKVPTRFVRYLGPGDGWTQVEVAGATEKSPAWTAESFDGAALIVVGPWRAVDSPHRRALAEAVTTRRLSFHPLFLDLKPFEAGEAPEARAGAAEFLELSRRLAHACLATSPVEAEALRGLLGGDAREITVFNPFASPADAEPLASLLTGRRHRRRAAHLTVGVARPVGRLAHAAPSDGADGAVVLEGAGWSEAPLDGAMISGGEASLGVRLEPLAKGIYRLGVLMQAISDMNLSLEARARNDTALLGREARALTDGALSWVFCDVELPAGARKLRLSFQLESPVAGALGQATVYALFVYPKARPELWARHMDEVALGGVRWMSDLFHRQRARAIASLGDRPQALAR